MITKINGYNQLEDFIKNNDLVIIDFNTVWCQPCKLLTPILEDLSVEFTNILFLSVDAENCKEIASKYLIESVPTLLFIKKDNITKRSSGYLPKRSLTKLINSFLLS